MKSLIFVLIWTFSFLVFGFYVNSEIYTFTEKYTDKINIIEKYVEADDFESANKGIKDFSKDWHKEKGIWYKLLEHDYFDSICLHLNVMSKNLSADDKSSALEQAERIKMLLDNILESEKCDLNHIF